MFDGPSDQVKAVMKQVVEEIDTARQEGKGIEAIYLRDTLVALTRAVYALSNAAEAYDLVQKNKDRWACIDSDDPN